MDNISSSRMERLGPDPERDTQPPPEDSKRKLRVAPARRARPVDLELDDQNDFALDDLELDGNPAPGEKHQLDERG